MSMRRIALLDGSSPANVLGIALWDSVSPWDPIGTGGVAATVDVTAASPPPGPGWTYAAGVFAIGPDPAIPDPAGFLRDVTLDASIALAVRVALAPWLFGLGAAIQASDTALIAAAWSGLVASVPIGTADRQAVVAHASARHVPGIA